jgi:hypothetical protein
MRDAGGQQNRAPPDYVAARDLRDLGGGLAPELLLTDLALSVLLPRSPSGATLRISGHGLSPLRGTGEACPGVWRQLQGRRSEAKHVRANAHSIQRPMAKDRR